MKRVLGTTHHAASAKVLCLCLAALGKPAAAQDTAIRGFADVTYTVADGGGGTNTFSLGQYDLFISSRLGEKWAFLAETVFEFVDDDFVADVERVVIEYRMSPGLRVAVGRMHSPIGYWFTRYHHGSLLEPTIDRPLAFRFEDEGGILSSHQVGLRVSGRDVGPLNLGYDLLVANGASATPVQDHNRDKAVTLRAFTQVDHATQLGGFFHRDVLAAGTPILGASPGQGGHPSPGGLERDVEQRAFGTFFAHQGARLEVQTEALRIRHEDASGATSNDSFYAYTGYRFGAWVPYLIYDRVDFAEHDSYYGYDSHNHVSGGLRWDATGTTVVKAEARSEHHGEAFRTFTVQVAVGF